MPDRPSCCQVIQLNFEQFLLFLVVARNFNCVTWQQDHRSDIVKFLLKFIFDLMFIFLKYVKFDTLILVIF